MYLSGVTRMNDIEKAIEYFYNQMERGLIENDTQQEVYETAISALEKHQISGWVSVSERLPEGTERVIVTLENGMVLEVFFISGEFKFQEGLPSGGMKKVSLDNPVVAWQSLPEPYREGQ